MTVQLARGDARAGSRATAVAADPVSGRSWIGAAVGGNDAGAVLALDGRGRRLRRFGSGAVVRFDGDATAPTAVAYGNGRLAVAATRRPCSGCQVLLLDPGSGARSGASSRSRRYRTARTRAAARTRGSAASRSRERTGSCSAARVDSCPTRLVVRDGALRPVADWDPGGPAGGPPVRTAVAAAGAPLDLCAGVERDGAVRLARVAASPPAPAPAACRRRGWTAGERRARGGRPARRPRLRRAAAAHGQARARAAGGERRQDGRPSPRCPAALRAGAIYRCKRHVLVVGTRRRGGVDRASVAVTPIVRR